MKIIAICKLEKEQQNKENEMVTAIADWLKEKIDKGELEEKVIKGICEEKKTLQNAQQYAYSQASQLQVGGCAVVKSEIVYKWIIDYYTQPMVIAKNNSLKKESNKKMKTKETCKKEKKKEKTVKLMEGEQLDLLDFL